MKYIVANQDGILVLQRQIDGVYILFARTASVPAAQKIADALNKEA